MSKKDDDDLIDRLQTWRLEPPPEGLAERIAREAGRHRQHRPLARRVSDSLERLLTEWRYGLAIKAGALAVCVVAGFAVGHLVDRGAGTEIDVLATALGQQDGWEREL